MFPLEAREDTLKEGYLALTFPMFDLGKSKHLSLGLDIMIWG
jgi:hypothetical protein